MSQLFNSIHARLMMWFLVVALIPLFTLSYINYLQTAQELTKKETNSAQELIEAKSASMDEWLDRRMSEVELASESDNLKSLDPSHITPFLQQIKAQSDVYEDVVFTGSEGIIEANTNPDVIGIDLSERVYIQKALGGEASYSEILESTGTGNRIITVAAPVTNESDQVQGVILATANFDALSETILNEETVQENLSNGVEVYLVDEDNRLQIAPDEDARAQSVDEAGLHAGLTNILEEKNETSDTTTYIENGEEFLVASAPVDEVDYHVYLKIPMEAILGAANSMKKNMFNAMLIAAVIVVLLALFVSRSIASPVKTLTTHVKQIAQGDLTNSEIKIKRKDEIGILARHFEKMTGNLQTLIHKVVATSSQVANSSEQLTANSEAASEAAEQISSATQNISLNAGEQAKSTAESQQNTEQIVNNMSSGIADILDRINNVTNLTNETVATATDGNETILQSVEQMKHIENQTSQTAATVNELGNKSIEIEEIVSVITNIAEQTNMLALNAAIEAARAGEHGSGFAIVADEVRKLAEQSAKATDQIRNLIQEIQEEIRASVAGMQEGTTAVKDGTTLTAQAGDSFNTISKAVNHVYENLQQVSTSIGEMNHESQKMVASIASVQTITSDFSSSTEEIAAAAEEQYASMEEIASASQMLDKMARGLEGAINSFKV